MITETAAERYARLLRMQPQLMQQVSLKYLGMTNTLLSRIRAGRCAAGGAHVLANW